MHELSITENLVQILEAQAKEAGFRKVLSVRLEVGALSTLEPDSLSFCFDIVAKETVAAEAQLEILRPAGKAVCRACNEPFLVAAYGTPCPLCQGNSIEIQSGTEMRVVSIEVE